MLKRTILTLIALTAFVPSAFAFDYIHPCGPSWSSLPVSYWINDAGSNDIPDSTLVSLVEDSFDAWGEPCCSNFAAQYQGRTGLTAINNNGRVVLSWEEQQWSTSFGNVNSTIGVTLTQFFVDSCTISSAPILFNGVGFTFSTDGSRTDIQSIATHEIGHLAGLDHSQFQQATMFAAYIGGTGARSLHQDDEDGICSLYTASCSCSNSSQCGFGQICVNSRCIDEPCDDVQNPCSAGLQCLDGECVEPTCTSDAQCDAGFACINRKCRSECAACRTCEDDADCGGQNRFCIPNNAGENRCLVLCDSVSCPGDADCYSVEAQQGTFQICGDPNATTELCPSTYTCVDEGGPMHECQNDFDCAAEQSCVVRNGVNVCETQDPCANIVCNENQTCVAGVCQDDASNNQNNNNNNQNNGNNNQNNSNNSNGNNSTGGGGPTIVIINQDSNGEGCATHRSAPLDLWLLVIGSLVAARRSRRRR